MTGVLALTSKEFFTKFNGKNFDDMMIPVIKKEDTRKRTLGNYKVINKGKNKHKDFEPVDFSNLPVFEFFKDVYENDNTLNTYTLTTIKDVRAEFSNRKPNGFWTLEKCMNSSKKCSSSIEWKISDYEAYSASIYYNWYEDCIKHMTIEFRLQSLCVKSAMKYTKIRDWKRKEKVTYGIALKYDFINICTKHMVA